MFTTFSVPPSEIITKLPGLISTPFAALNPFVSLIKPKSSGLTTRSRWYSLFLVGLIIFIMVLVVSSLNETTDTKRKIEIDFSEFYVFIQEDGINIRDRSLNNLSVITQQDLKTNFGDDYRDKILEVRLPATEIKEGAFEGCEKLTSVNFPLMKGDIGNQAFVNCKSLTTVNFQAMEGNIGFQTFGYCQNLTSVNFPAMTGYIGYGAFVRCIKLTSVKFPLVDTIQRSAFNECQKLGTGTPQEDVIFSERVQFIGADADGPKDVGTFGGRIPATIVTDDNDIKRLQFNNNTDLRSGNP